MGDVAAHLLTSHMRTKTKAYILRHSGRSDEGTLDDDRLRDLIESRTIQVGNEEHRLWLVGFSQTPNNGALLAIAISGTDERLQLQLSDDLRRDPIALRQRVVYFAKRIVNATRPVSGYETLNIRRWTAEGLISPSTTAE